MKSKYISKICVSALLIILLESFTNAISDESIRFSIADSQLKNANGSERKDANDQAISELIETAKKYLKEANERRIDEGDGEAFEDIISDLSMTGDKRVAPILYEIMLCPYVSDWDVAKGFLRIGKSTFPQLLKYLYSINDPAQKYKMGTKLNIIVTLTKMGEFDSTGTYFTENDKKIIRKEMLKLIKDKDENMRRVSVMALGYYGDQSTIQILNEIKQTDPYLSGKYYVVRMEAEKAINHLQKLNK
jgi:hypothetical protein